MAYLGRTPTSTNFPVDRFSGDNTTIGFTLSQAAATKDAILVFISGVKQKSDSYSLVGASLSFSEAPPVGTENIEVLHLGVRREMNAVPFNSVGKEELDLDNDAEAIRAALNLDRKNLIINSNFDVWQRGTYFAASAEYRYSADRWHISFKDSTGEISRQEFTLGQTIVPHNPKYFHRSIIVTAGLSNSYSVFTYRFPDVSKLSGKTYTLSFWAKADAIKNIATEFSQYFGDGGSPSVSVDSIGITTHTQSTGWQKFTSTVTFPSVTGKTLGDKGNDFTQLLFWLDAGSNLDARTNSLGTQSGTFDIAQVQLEEGSTATTYEELDYETTLLKCGGPRDGDPIEFKLNPTGSWSPTAHLLAGRKNYIINGNFDIWQRGNSFSTSNGTYTSDRWKVNKGDSSSGTVTVDRITNAVADSNWNSGNPKYVSQINASGITGGTNKGAQLWQVIEGVRTLVGKKATLSFSINNNGASPFNINARLQQNYGTGGTPSTVFDFGDTVLNAPVGRSHHSITFDVPTLDGKTLGTNGDDGLLVIFALDVNTDAEYHISSVQLEEGIVATDFEQRPIAEELKLCQRYYEDGDTKGAFIVTNASGSSNGYFQFLVQKRAVPTMIKLSGDSTLSAPTHKAFISQKTGAGAGTADSHNTLWAADAEL